MSALVSALFAIGLVIPTGYQARAATPGQLPQEPGLPDSVAPVGSLVGAVAVNPFGSGLYTLPLELPATRGDLMPPLALVNNPDAGPGQYGYGWAITGLSVIDQCHVGDGEYGYCLDGAPLVPVPLEQTSFDQDGGHPESLSELHEYRTYPDSGLRISRVSEPLGLDGLAVPITGSRWKVESPTGRVSHFEGCLGTCVESLVSDSHGNYIEIEADHDDTYGVILRAIHYEGSLATGETPEQSVVFHENGIEVPARYYWFQRAPYRGCSSSEYTPTNGCSPLTSGESGGSGYQLLSSVTVCAGDFPVDGASPVGGCIPPTRFEYRRRPDHLEPTISEHNTDIPVDPCHGPFFGDFDGDGRTDGVWGAEGCETDELYFWPHGGEPWDITTVGSAPQDATLMVDDVDGDGSQDLAFFDTQAKVHVISKIRGASSLHREFDAGHEPGEFVQATLADINNDAVLDIVSCEGSAKLKIEHEKFPEVANRVHVYVGQMDDWGHAFADVTTRLYDPKVEALNEVGCEPGPIQVRHGFGGDFVMFAKTGYYGGRLPPPGQHSFQLQMLSTDLEGDIGSHPPLSLSQPAPIPRMVFFDDGVLTERVPNVFGGGKFDWQTDWLWEGAIPVSTDDGAGRILELPMTGGGASLRRRRLEFVRDSLEVGANLWPRSLPRVSSERADDTFVYNGDEGWAARLYDTDDDGVVDFIGPELLHSFFYDWNGDGAADYFHPARCHSDGECGWTEPNDFPEVHAFGFLPPQQVPDPPGGAEADDDITEGYFDEPSAAVPTGMNFASHVLGGGEERVLAPFTAQDDNDPELEIWLEREWGTIQVFDRSGVGAPMALSAITDGHGLRTEVGYSPAPTVHTNQTCLSPSAAVLEAGGRHVRCLNNERRLVHAIREIGGENGRRTRQYRYVDGAFDSITGRFLGFDRIIETETLNSPAFAGDTSKVVRVRGFEDPRSYPEPARLGPSLSQLLDYELTLYIDDRVEFAGENNDRAELVDYVWSLDGHARRFVASETHHRVYEMGHDSGADTLRLSLPSIHVLDGLDPTYETSDYVDNTDAYGNVTAAHSVTEGEVTSTHRTFSRVVAAPFTETEISEVTTSGRLAVEFSTRGRWRPSRPSSETITYADGEVVSSTFVYNDEISPATTTCTPWSSDDLACAQASDPSPDSSARGLAEVVVSGSGQPDQRRSYLYDDYGNVVVSRYVADDGVSTEHHAQYDPDRHLFRVGTHGPTGLPGFSVWDSATAQPVATIDAYSRETHFRYDGLGRLTQTTVYGAEGSEHSASVETTRERVWGLGVDAEGLPTASPERVRSTFGDGRWEEVTTGPAGLPLKYRWSTGSPKGPAFSEVQYSPFELGRVYRASEPAFEGEEQNWATVIYDASGRILRQIQPDGAEFRTRYFPRSVWEFDAEGNPPQRYEFDGHGRVVRVLDAFLTPFCYQYDARSNLDQVQKGCSANGADEVVDFDYDVFGRLEQLEDPSSGTTTYDYDGRGRLLDTIDGNGDVREWSYDALDRVLTETTAAGVRSNYYDSPSTLPAEVASHLSTIEDSPGLLIARAFDGNGTISTAQFNQFGDVVATVDVVDDVEYIHGFSYDSDERVAAIAYPNAGAEWMVVKLGYDGAGQLESVQDAVREETLLTVLSRDAHGQVIELEHFGGATTTQSYDDAGRLLTRATVIDGQTTFDQEYAYTPNGNVDSRWNHQSGLHESFVYDLLGRLTGSSLAGTWDYDDYGNHLDVTATPGGQLLDVPGVYAVAYDDAGRMTSYDDGIRKLSVVWSEDGDPAVIHASQPCCDEMSPQDVGDETVELFYGAAGELVRRRASYADDAAVERDSVYVSGFEQTTSDDGASGSSTLTRRWSLPSVAGVSLSASVTSGSEQGFRYHAGTADNLGSVQSVISATFDGKLQTPSKSSADARSYDPWGRPRAESFGAGGASFDDVNDGFTGHRAQLDGGAVDMNLRHYDPTSRRFLSPDPVIAGVYDTQAWNRYAYVRNNPLRWIDPTGAYGQSSNGGMQFNATYAPPPGGVVAVLAAAISSAVASGAVQGFFKSVGRTLRRAFRIRKGSRGGGGPSTTTPPGPITGAKPSVMDHFQQAGKAKVGRLLDAAGSGISAVQQAWQDPTGTVSRGATSYYGTVAGLGRDYVEYAGNHFVGMGKGAYALGQALIADPLGTSATLAHDTAFGLVDNVVQTANAYPATAQALWSGDFSGAADAYGVGVKNVWEGASKVVGGAGTAKGLYGFVRNGLGKAAKGGGGGKAFAMGIDQHLDDFAREHGATTWKQFANPEAWKSQVLQKLRDPNQRVLFNTKGVEAWPGASRAAAGRGGATDWELLQIQQNKFPNLEFWKDGARVANPFD